MQETSYGSICKEYTENRCPFGISGKGCDFYHPKLCRPYVKFGSYGKRGCKKGSSCSFFHPKLCNKSLKPVSQRICTNQSCMFFHLPRTKRHNVNKPTLEKPSKRHSDAHQNGHRFENQNPKIPLVEHDPFLGNMIRNIVRESIQVELAALQNMAPNQMKAPPFLPGMSHFSEPWKTVAPTMSSQQTLPNTMTQAVGPSQWSC